MTGARMPTRTSSRPAGRAKSPGNLPNHHNMREPDWLPNTRWLVAGKDRLRQLGRLRRLRHDAADDWSNSFHGAFPLVGAAVSPARETAYLRGATDGGCGLPAQIALACDARRRASMMFWWASWLRSPVLCMHAGRQGSRRGTPLPPRHIKRFPPQA